MVFINSDGKFNENTYLIDAELYRTKGNLAILDNKNKNLFTGDAIINMYERETFSPTFMPPDFNESELLKLFKN